MMSEGGDHVVIFLPNLLMADNQLKLVEIYRRTNRERDIYWAIWQGQQDLSRSLKTAKTEWAFKVKKEFEEDLAKK
jgi:HKD family nuclease